jgi:hypothetical protein
MRVYRLPLVATAVTAAVDLAEINPATSQMLKLLGFRFGQSTELSDAQDEELPVTLVTGFTTSGSGGNAAVTAPPDDVGDAAFGGTCETFNTTQANTGTTISRILGTFKVIQGELLWIPVPFVENPGGIWIPYNTRAVIRIPAPADSITIGGEVIFGTIGAA